MGRRQGEANRVASQTKLTRGKQIVVFAELASRVGGLARALFFAPARGILGCYLPMSVIGPIATPLLLLVLLWVASFFHGVRSARRAKGNLPPTRPSPEVSSEQAEEIVQSTARWGWCKVCFAILCVGAMYAVAILLFWPVWVGNRVRSPAGR